MSVKYWNRGKVHVHKIILNLERSEECIDFVTKIRNIKNNKYEHFF